MLLLFTGSGCAALVYEIVWLQLLSLIIGSSAVSLGVLLGTYMGGMCLGSLLFARVVSPRRNPLAVYAAIEAAIAVSAVLILVVLPYAGGLYIAVGGSGIVGLSLRGVLAGVCLLPPTMLMGATLPAISRWVQATCAEASSRISWLGLFYGANTVGAVLGCILAGYYLLRVYDMTVATWLAVAMNAVVALLAWLLSRRAAQGKAAGEAGPPARLGGASLAESWPIYVAIGISGMTALAAEVVWTRLLSLLLGATVYTFSLILAVFLTGLGIGSGVGSAAARTTANPRAALGVCQCVLVAAILWAAWSLGLSLPYWPVNPALSSRPVFQFQIDLARCLWALLPAACAWGASFPLALASISPGRQDLGRLVGRVYGANTVGGIVGAIATSLVLVPWIGTQQCQRLLIAATALSASLVLVPVPTGLGELAYDWGRVLSGAAALAMLRWVASAVPPLPPELVAWGHDVALRQGQYGEILYMGEGMNSSMAVSQMAGVRSYHNAGKIQASSLPKDMRLQRMLGHLSTLVAEHPRNVLVIACGAGVTAGAVSIDPAVERETVAEIESLVPRRVAPLFADQNFDVVHNRKVHLEVDDARHFVLTTHERFDAITSDPFDPWVKGAATLYTKEFFELLKEHLNPGGVITVFVQLYESSQDTVRSEVATFFDAFPDAMVFGNTDNGSGYDVVLLGQVHPRPIDIDAITDRLQRPEYAAVSRSLLEIGFGSVTALFSTYAARLGSMHRWLKGAEINRDRNLRLQYLAGLSMNAHDEAQIYAEMTRDWAYPEGLFVGSGESLGALRAAMNAR